MATKRVEVSSVNYREFVKAVLALGAQGATLPDDSGVFKGVLLRCCVEVDEDVLVEQNQIVRVLPTEKSKKPKEAKDVKPKNKKEKTNTEDKDVEDNASD